MSFLLAERVIETVQGGGNGLLSERSHSFSYGETLRKCAYATEGGA